MGKPGTKTGWKELLTALGVVIAAGVGALYLKKKDFGMDDIDSGIAYAKAKIFGSAFFGGAPSAIEKAVPAVNATVKPMPTPPKPFLLYDGIKIIGDYQFQKDVVMSLEFARKYNPPDSELRSTKEIESDSVERMAGGEGYTSVNKNWIHDLIEKKLIRNSAIELKHEDYHNYASLNDPKNNTEKLANEFSHKLGDNLIYVNQSEIDRFYQEFNFSQFKK